MKIQKKRLILIFVGGLTVFSASASAFSLWDFLFGGETVTETTVPDTNTTTSDFCPTDDCTG